MSEDHILVYYSGDQAATLYCLNKKDSSSTLGKNVRKDEPSVVQETNLYSSTSMNVNEESANLFIRYDIVCSYVTHCS